MAMDTIDLTLDSDEDDAPPNPAKHPAPKCYSDLHESPTSRPKKPTAPLPTPMSDAGNTAHLRYKPVRRDPFQDPSQTFEATGASQRGEKRRKLSASGADAPCQSRSWEHVGQTQRAKDGGRLQTMNNIPTVQPLQSALKTNGTAIPYLDDLASRQPKALHIERMSDAVDYRRLQRPNHTLSIGQSLPSSPIQIISDDDDMDAGADLESVEKAFAPRRSPLRKPAIRQVSKPVSNIQPSYLLDGHDGDGSILETAWNRSGPTTFDAAASSSQDTPTMKPTPKQNGASSKRAAHKFTMEDDHLIIFLKEVKKVKWRDFKHYFPERKWYTLQTRYSQKLNKRDRTQDPPQLQLPPQFAAESVIDWATVHQETSAPRVSTGLGLAAISQPSQVQPQQHFSPFASTLNLVEGESLSGAESASRRERPRRTVPVQDYAWPRRVREARAEVITVEDEATDITDIDTPGYSEPSVESVLIPDEAIPVENPPMDADFRQEDSNLALAATCRKSPYSFEEKLPYLACSQRLGLRNVAKDWEWDQLSTRDWQGSLLHVDFSTVELDIVEQVTLKLLKPTQLPLSRSPRKRLHALLSGQSESRMAKLASGIRRKLHSRDSEGVKAFLRDAQSGYLSAVPRIERLGAARPDRQYSSAPRASTSTIVRDRELGLQSRRGWNSASRQVTYQLTNKLQDSLGPAYYYTGASSDVHTVAWSPDGQCFAAGAVSVTDAHSMQYNRPNNLLYGNVPNRAIHELREHYDWRVMPESGPNSTHEMHESLDPKLYTSVSSVAFSPDGRFMFSAGYDKHACIWEISRDSSQPKLAKALTHKGEVDMLTVSCTGKIATATKKDPTLGGGNAIKVITLDEDTANVIDRLSFTSQKAGQRPDLNILPTALQFEPRNGRLLLAGFGANQREGRPDITGDICLWDLETQQQLNVHGSARNIFDVAWNPDQRSMPWFAVGCVAGANANRGERSVLRLYDGFGLEKYSRVMELGCKALDMNDVLFCPHDEFLIAAGCTSGRAYVWDLRWPDRYLRELAHSTSLMPLDDYTDREITDTGVRFLSWGGNASRLYTGSSDGVVKVWDVIRSEEETFVKDLITVESGIMSGAFSPDMSKLILGEVNGSVNILEVGRDDCSFKDAEKLKYMPYIEDEDMSQSDGEAKHPSASGVAIAFEMLASRQMLQVPFGGLPVRQAVQGPNYNGPYDLSVDAPFLREQALEMQYNLATTSGQECSIQNCKDGIVKITCEEVGDSGRSVERIPDELRRQWKSIDSDQTLFPGKSRCTNCGRAARPPANDSGVPILCERCAFACFRCGSVNQVRPETETLTCGFCRRTWSIGALGYECENERNDRAEFSGIPLLKGYDKDILNAKMSFDDDATFGDEMNALTDYFHSLATDRPESPPL